VSQKEKGKTKGTNERKKFLAEIMAENCEFD
jgi:hypothetical protein